MSPNPERWLPIDGFPGYQISDQGRVRRSEATWTVKPAILSTRGRRAGYPSICLCRDGKRRTFSVHVLVARAFLGPCPDGQEVNHKNGIKTDPRLENLEYVTPLENWRHAVATGLRTNRPPTNARLVADEVRQIRADVQRGAESRQEIAARFGISWRTVEAIAQGRRWAHV